MPQHDDNIVVIRNLSKAFLLDERELIVLSDISLEIRKASFTAVCGPSGSGKTTLLNIIGGIDRPSQGKVLVAGQELTGKDEDFLSEFRCNHLGFVFQSYNLVSTLTVAENVAFPMEWLRKDPKYIENRVDELLRVVGLENRSTHFSAQLSGGEQQRVAFARALANDPEIILADEPTGNLDQKNAKKILQVLQTLKNEGKTVIVSTHDHQIMALAEQIICLEDGRLVVNHE